MSKKEKKEPLKRGTIIDNYQIDDLIGQGGYGEIYTVHKLNEQSLYAMKIENLDCEKQGLVCEIETLQKLQDSPYFPKINGYGVTNTFRYLVMSLFGLSISNTRRLLPNRRMTLLTVCRIGIFMIDCIESLHNHGFIHRDVKPGNFIFSDNYDCPLILIDFGLSKSYIDPKTHQPFPERPKSGFRGTSKYASLNAHSYKDQSQRDDLISWMYSLIELYNGRLIWSKAKDNASTRKIKQATADTELLAGLPPGFSDIWYYINTLGFAEKPNYDKIRKILCTVIYDTNKSYYDPFDWEALPESKLSHVSPFVPLPAAEKLTQNYLDKYGIDGSHLNEESSKTCHCCRI